MNSSSPSRLPLLTGFLAVLTFGACDRSGPVPTSDSVMTATRSEASTQTVVGPSGRQWDVEAGPFLVLPTVEGGEFSGSLLRPESTDLTVGDTTGVAAALSDGRIDLFSRTGRVGQARVTLDAASPPEPGCTAWPVARLAVDAGVAMPVWTVAFAAGRVEAVPLDSIEGMAPRDSARLAIDLTRLASGLSDDSSSTFRGLPFVVLRAWRSRGIDSGFVVATLVRRVNQEDDPKEERLVVVVDAFGASSRDWTVAWHERASGHEDEMIVAEPLLAFRNAGNAAIRLLFGRDDGEALSAAVLTRERRGWTVLWESAVAGCR